MRNLMLLAADVGGSKTDLAMFSPEMGPRAPLAQRRYQSMDYPGLEAMVREFLTDTGLRATWASVDVAGPVVDGRAKLTNLPWAIDAANLRDAFGLDGVSLLNDLEAIATAIPHLRSEDVVCLNKGQAEVGGAIAVIAPGTGLGEAFLTNHETGYQAHASEGGHANFAPLDELQIGLLRFLLQRFDHVSVERVCSGIGIPNIYGYLARDGYPDEAPDIAANLELAADRTPLIIDAALAVPPVSPRCAATLDTFMAILGAEASNLALTVLASGGVYLAGGIPPRIMIALQRGIFMDAFLRKGRFSELLSQVPVHVVVNRTELLGAAIFGLRMSTVGEP
jgi:glucokinase